MLRNMYVVQYIEHYSAWYLSKKMLIDAEKTKYDKGDIIVFKDKKYLVIEDYTCLRVSEFSCTINPLVPLINLIPNV